MGSKMKLQQRQMFYMEHTNASLRYQFMETEAFQDLMEHRMLDPAENGENSIDSGERRSQGLGGISGLHRRADSTCEDNLRDQDLPDSPSCGIFDRKIRKRSQIH